MAQFADNSMIPQLKGIWRECFGDPETYIDFYFEHRFEACNMLVHIEGRQPVAMLTMLPAMLKLHGIYEQARYIYAVATLPDWRGKGISTKLLDAARQYMKGEGVKVSVLVPANDGLFEFYATRGYKTAFYMLPVEVPAHYCAQAGEAQVSPMPLMEYKMLRDKTFDAELYLRWDMKALAYAVKEAEFGGGGVFKITIKGREYFAVCHRYATETIIKDTNLTMDALYDCAGSICSNMGTKKLRARLNPKICGLTNAVKFGMIETDIDISEDITTGYMGLMLD